MGSLAAVPILEDDYGITVVTNPVDEVWRLIDIGVAPPGVGYWPPRWANNSNVRVCCMNHVGRISSVLEHAIRENAV